jgi:hypothetical protein
VGERRTAGLEDPVGTEVLAELGVQRRLDVDVERTPQPSAFRASVTRRTMSSNEPKRVRWTVYSIAASHG